jgi:tyrosinase
MHALRILGFSSLAALALGTPTPVPQDDGVTATSSFPAAAATNTQDAANLLANLLSDAQDTAKDILNSTSSQKRGGCTLNNLSIRREW